MSKENYINKIKDLPESLRQFIGLIFIFQSYGVGIFSSLFVVGLNLVELMVAGIQAYVFTMFSSVYIGLAIEDDH